MSTPLSPSASDVQKEIESVLENDEAYGSNVTILNWSSTPTKITGKFKDAWNDRVFDFTIDEDGVGYKPSVNLDAVPVESQESRFDSFSDGYLSGIRIDGKLTGKRVKKPKCGGTSYGCGYSCVELAKVCRVLSSANKKGGTNYRGKAIGKERLKKLIALAESLKDTDKNKSSALNAIASEIGKTRNKFTGGGVALILERNFVREQSKKQQVDLSLAKEELVAAQAVTDLMKQDETTKLIATYIIQGYPTHSVYFAKQVGIHTATMAARSRAIAKAAAAPDGQTLQDRLKRILQVKYVAMGGQGKS